MPNTNNALMGAGCFGLQNVCAIEDPSQNGNARCFSVNAGTAERSSRCDGLLWCAKW